MNGWQKLTSSLPKDGLCSICRFRLKGCSYALCPGVRVQVGSVEMEKALQSRRKRQAARNRALADLGGAA